MKQLHINDVQDPKAQENFRRLQEFLREFPLFKGAFQFRVFELAGTSYPQKVTYMHRLGFMPKDLLVTSIIGGAVTWHYDEFTATNVVATITAPATVRAFVGAYAEGRIV